MFTDCFSGPDPNEVQHAKELCESLLENVKEQYARFKENPPQQRGYGYQQEGQQGGDRQGYGGGYGSYGGAQSPAAATPVTPGPPGASSNTDYSAQYAQYYGGQDPYAAYGGYQNYVAYYQYYQQQAAQQQGAPGAPPGSAPPAPPADDAPPPPPPSGSPPGTNGGYNSVRLPGLFQSGSDRYGDLLRLTQGFIGATSSRNVRRTREGERQIVEGSMKGGLFFSVGHHPDSLSFCIAMQLEVITRPQRQRGDRL